MPEDLYGKLLQSAKQAPPAEPLHLKGQENLSGEQKFNESIKNLNIAYQNQQNIAQIKKQRQEEQAQKERAADEMLTNKLTQEAKVKLPPNAPQEVVDVYIENRKRTVKQQAGQAYDERLNERAKTISDDAFISITDLNGISEKIKPFKDGTAKLHSGAFKGNLNTDFYEKDGRPTPEFKRKVIELAGTNPERMKAAAQAIILNKVDEFEKAPSEYKKAIQSFYDWAYESNIPLPIYKTALAAGSGAKGLLDIGAALATGIVGVGRLATGTKGEKSLGRLYGDATQNVENLLPVSQASNEAELSFKTFKDSPLSYLDAVLNNATRSAGEYVLPGLLTGGEATVFQGVVGAGKKAARKGLLEAGLANQINANLANSTANRAAKIAYETLNKLDGSKAIKYMDNMVNTTLAAGAPVYASYYDQLLEAGYDPEEAASKAYDRTAINMLTESLVNPFAKVASSTRALPGRIMRAVDRESASTKLGKTVDFMKRHQGYLKDAVGGTIEETSGSLADSYQDFRDAKMRGDLPQDAEFNWKESLEQAANEGIVGFVSEGVLSTIGGHGRATSNPQSLAIFQALNDRQKFGMTVVNRVEKGKLAPEQGAMLNRFLDKIEPEVKKAQEKGLKPEMAVKMAVEGERLKEVTQKLEALRLQPEIDIKELERLQTLQRESAKTLTQLEKGTYIKGRTISGEEMRDIAKANTPNELKGVQSAGIVANGPYKSEVIDITPFEKDPEIQQMVAVLSNPEIAGDYKAALDPLLEEREAIESKYRPKVDKKTGITLVPKREKTEEDKEELAKINKQIGEVHAQFEGLKGQEDVIGFTPANEVPPVVEGERVIDGKKRIAHALANGETEMEVARPLTNEEADAIVAEESDQIIGTDEADFEGLDQNESEHLEYVSTLFDLYDDPAKGYTAAAKELIDRGVSKKKSIDLLSRIQNNNQPKTVLTQYYNSVKNNKRAVPVAEKVEDIEINPTFESNEEANGTQITPSEGQQSPSDNSGGNQAQKATPRKRKGAIKNPAYRQALDHDVDSPLDRVLQYFIGGGRIHTSAIKDLFKGGKSDYQAYIWATSNSAPTIDQLAHQMWESLPDGDERYTTSEFRDAVEEALRGYTSRTDMAEDLNKRHTMPDENEQAWYDEQLALAQDEEVLDEAIDIAELLSDEELEKIIADHERLQDDYYESEGFNNLDPARTTKYYEEIAGLTPNVNTGRIPVDPIYGGKPKNLSKIIFDVSKGVKQRLFFLKPGRRRTLGTYSPGNSAVKIKFNGDLDTTAHEIGHSIDDRFGLLSDLATTSNLPVEQELLQFSPFGSKPPKGHPNPRLYELGEGFAEWLRAYIANPTAAKAAAPNVYALYDSKVSDEYKKQLDQFSTDFRTFAGATGRDMTLANVALDPKKKKNLVGELLSQPEQNSDFKFSFVDKIAANMVNPLRALNVANDYAKGLKGIDTQLPEDDPNILARTLLGVDGKVSEILDSGMIDANLNVLTENGQPKNLKWLLEPLDNFDQATIQREKNDVISYMIAERTVELSNKFDRNDILTGIGGGVFKDVDVARKTLKEFEAGDPLRLERIKESARRYRELSDDVLKYMVEKGRMSQEQYDNIKKDNTQYVALQRVMEVEPDREVEVYAKGGGKLASKVDVVNKIKGSTKEILDPYTSLLKTIYKGVREADRNEVLLSFRDMILPNRGMYEGEQVRLADVGVKASQGDKETITIFVDGKPEHWKFQNDIYKALKGLDSEVYRLPQLITALPRLLRWTVTHFPVFAAKNVTRDTQDRMIKSNSNSIKNGFGLTDLVGDKEHWHEVARAGGLNAGYYLKDQDHYYGLMKEAMDKMAQNKKSIILDPSRWKEGWKGYENLLGKSETVNRVAEYRAALRKAKAEGMDDYNAKLFAAYQSRDLLDFALMGHWMKVANQLVPFSNAAVQGLRSAAVRAKENPKGFAIRLVLLSMIPSMAEWLLNHGDEDDAEQYEELPDYQRDLFYNFKIGDNKFAAIPKPYELSLGGAGISRILSLAYGNEKAFDGFGKTVLDSSVPFDAGNIAGPGQTIMEGITNYEFFRNKYIIPPYEQPLTLALRDRDMASQLGKALEYVAGVDARKIDHFIKGSTSYFGNTAMKVSNIGREDGDKFDLTDLGFVKKSPAYNSKSVQELLRIAAEYGLSSNGVVKTFKALSKEYFAAKTDEEQERLSKQMIDYAQKHLPELEALAQVKLDEAK